ncbi:MAG: DHH family phosphoesterase [Candidatus Baldrarchaeia archaeon]
MRKPDLSRYRKIVSDGDWDGVFASGLLMRVTDLPVEFPRPSELPSAELERVVTVEIGPTKVRAMRDCLIIDHHEVPELPSGCEMLVDMSAGSAAEIVAKVWELEVPREWLGALSEIDSARVSSDLAKKMWAAYRANVENFPRREVAEMIRDGRWEDLYRLVVERAEEYRKIEEKVPELVKRGCPLEGVEGVAILTYDPDDKVERGASKDAMLRLEETYDVVVAIGAKSGRFSRATIGTRSERVNLAVIFEFLRNRGYNAGGKAQVGGVQARGEVPLEVFMRDLQEAFRKAKWKF